MTFKIQPGRPMVNHDAPPHRCPICQHRCQNYRKKNNPQERLGRPPKTQDKLVRILRFSSSEYRPMPPVILAERLDQKLESIYTLVLRARKNGINIRWTSAAKGLIAGYWLDEKLVVRNT
jgi:hypothetical protein